jgi:hypothetical protein
MYIIKKNALFSLLFLALCATNKADMNAMNKFRAKVSEKFGWKTFAATALAGQLTLIHYGCSLYPNYKAYSIQKQSKLDCHDNAPKVSPTVQQFVMTQIKQQPVNNKQLTIRQGTAFAAANLKNPIIWIENADSIDQALKIKSENQSLWMRFKKFLGYRSQSYVLKSHSDGTQHEKTIDEYLTEVAAIIHHENAHLINNHSKKLYAAFFAIPLTTELLHYALKRKFRTLNQYALNNALKIPTGLLKGYCNGLSFFAFNRFCEQQADEGVDDNIHLLEAYIKHFNEHHQLVKQANDEKPFYRNFSTHPSFERRTERFEQRIRELKQKNDPKYYEDPLVIKEQEIK